ncbi:MAG TPA: 30S ribosomal protein S6 [Smithella sp.]|nr:30S ribosomal protein S6 [Smithella sp.]NMC96281.1 30S ribosomal protein S6 [Deltaproteobacteria bacterium]OQC53770.1 MAG: 30S ribosomal protein S6 [Deltaproteobacteria bacterium ADurb.Bin022]HNQ65553.1 30S ribosomal protein S6 [Smithella sp.]HOE32988.1 30S ribosomal protein S6 [Smithella sp.]
MQRYEVVAIVLADLIEDEINALIERSQTIITDRKGVIAKVDKWGKRHLAYEIKKQRDGYYFLIDFAGNGSIVNEIERNYKIDDRVIKFMTVKKEGATTAEGIQQEAAAAEAKRVQAKVEAEAAAAEGKQINQIEKAPRESRPRVRKDHNKEETQTKGE